MVDGIDEDAEAVHAEDQDRAVRGRTRRGTGGEPTGERSDRRSTMSACLPCELEAVDDERIVYRDDDWAVEVAPGSEVPGWYLLRLRRHAEGWDGPTPAELAGFGPRTSALVAAVTAEHGAETVYVMSFGENYRHFHVLVTARGPEVPAEQRGPGVLARRATHLDPEAAIAAVPGMRTAMRVAVDELAPIEHGGAA